MNSWDGPKQALFDNNLDIYAKEVTSLMGPSGCGKSAFKRCLIRNNEIVAASRLEGSLTVNAQVGNFVAGPCN